MPEEVCKSLCSEGTVVVNKTCQGKNMPEELHSWATYSKVGTWPKRLQHMEELNPEQRKTGKKQGTAAEFCYAHEPNLLHCLSPHERDSEGLGEICSKNKNS